MCNSTEYIIGFSFDDRPKPDACKLHEIHSKSVYFIDEIRRFNVDSKSEIGGFHNNIFDITFNF